jgi:L-seryl-tRNA(Ser) seleniumtransferase
MIPSIERLRRRPAILALEARFGADATIDALRAATAEARSAIAGGDTSLTTEIAVSDMVEAAAALRLGDIFRPSLEPVINATGVILHTNLGRAPLAPSAVERVAGIACGYSTLEYDLARGGRGRRDVHAEALLCRLTGAEAAVVVNNNAAATWLMLAALASGREVIVSRGELVEIGGGFRVPDVMAQSGAILREVGTTNKTRASDFAAAISEKTALILRVHPSNFRIEGFTERPSLTDLVTLGTKFNIPVAEDLGSGHIGSASGAHRVPIGSTADAHRVPIGSAADAHRMPMGSAADGGQMGIKSRLGASPDPMGSEPEVHATVAAGVDVCCFSGDKLLGGPQAGIIVGRAALIERIRKHPLMRALRVDKMTYAALEATLTEYAAGRAAATVPVQRMLTMTPDEVRERAEMLTAAIVAIPRWQAEIVAGTSAIGGGSAPGVGLPTWLVALAKDGLSPAALEVQLRGRTPPIIARIENGRLLLDLRTVLPEQDALLAALLTSA